MPAKNNLLVISTYAPKNSLHGNKYSAIASYAKNTLTHLSNLKEIKVCVLSDIDKTPESYYEDGIEVIRCWKRNSLNLYLNLLKNILKKPDYQRILFEFEFGMFGGSKILIGLMPLFFLVLKILGKKVFVVSHGVILDAQEVSDQLGFDKDSLKSKIFGIGLKVIYYLMCLLSTKIIVFEGYLKNKLADRIGFRNKIVVIPHGVETVEANISKEEARRLLNIPQDKFILLNFGFVIWYKGTDWLIKTFSEGVSKKYIDPEKINLIVAGGFSNVHGDDPVYKKYMDEVNGMLKDKNYINMTGFLDESKINVYFAASDLVVLPYRILISASGPFSFILSNNKPFILSQSLEGYTASDDFSENMKANGLTEDQIFFEMKMRPFAQILNTHYNNPRLSQQVGAFSKDLSEERGWQKVGDKYSKLIFN